MSDPILIISSLIAVLFTIFVGILIAWKLHIRKHKHLVIPDGCFPIIGHTFLVKSPIHDYFQDFIFEFIEDHGPTCVFFLYWKPLVFTKDLNFTKTILSSQQYLTKSKQMELLHDWTGISLLTGTGQLWRERRRLITPAFHLDILSTNMLLLEKQSSKLVSFIKGQIKTEKYVKFSPLSRYFALGVICEFSMGLPLVLDMNTDNKKSIQHLSDISDDLVTLLNKRFFNPFVKSNTIYKFTKDGKKYFSKLKSYKCFVKSIVEKRIKFLDLNKSEQGKIFTDILLEAYQKNLIDFDELLNEVNTFLFVGNETISFNLYWSMIYLGKYINIQEKLFEEIIFLKRRKLTIEQKIKKAKYLDCFVKEVMRLTSMNSLMRRIVEDTSINGVVYPSGAEVSIQIHNIHLDGNNWKQPELFEPERFLDEESRDYNFKFLPFSAGPRNCIGKRFGLTELKIAISYLIFNFEIKLIKELPSPYKYSFFVNKDTEFMFTPRDFS